MFPTNEEEALKALKGDDPTLAATAEAILWRTWCRSGNSEVDRIFRSGIDAMQKGKLEEAENTYRRAIELRPPDGRGPRR